MGIVFLAMGATGATVFPLWLLFCWLFKSNNVRMVAGGVLVVLFVPLFLFFFQSFLAATVRFGVNVDPSEVPHFDVPVTATEVSFYSIHGPTCLYAEFKISEEDFLRWMKGNEWTVESIVDFEEVDVVETVIDGSYVRRNVGAGYRWDSYDDSGTTVVFDQENSRAYVRISMW